MGTGIVATAGATLPVHVPGLRVFATVVWVAAAVLAGGAHRRRWSPIGCGTPTVARSHARNPQMAHFYGAAPMALLTVGAGAVLVGRTCIGERAAVDLDWVLWTAGTLGGLFTAMSIPYLMFTQYRVERRRRVRRLADAGGAADGVGGDGRAADPAHGAGHRVATTHALRLLRDVRAVARRVADHHHHGVEPARRTSARRAPPRGPDAVDRARARSANPSPPQGFSARTPRWPSTRTWPTG